MEPLLLGCTVCYGDPASPLTKGAEAGVIVLGVCILFVLVGFAGLFLYWMRRAKALERALDAAREETPLPADAVRLETPAVNADAPPATH